MASPPRTKRPLTRPRRPAADSWALIPLGASNPVGDDAATEAVLMPLAAICPAEGTEVVKRLKPGQPGTLSLHRRYGPALVCVRYRKDVATGNTRFTTVELVIDQGPQRRQPLIRVDIRFDDIETRRQAIALGAEWDADEKTWRMPRRAAIQLGLVRQGKRGRKNPAEPA
ncbi:hypothetical protein AACH06_03200 [Ideonella sp. DXS29W]|uniref:Uncharacterized protein n=1 Tax=Ideonella lacteola TaxID=2984193 RepID=A0ABU9BMR1_9BURK